MTYTYAFSNEENTTIKRTDENGNIVFVPTDPANRDYAEYLESGITAEAYVAPPAPPEPTAEEKLASAGLTVAELQTLLGL